MRLISDRSVSIARDMSDYVVIRIANDSDVGMSLRVETNAQWLLSDVAEQPVIEPGESGDIRVLVNWSAIPSDSGSVDSQVTVFDILSKSAVTVRVAAFPRQRKVCPVTVMGAGRVDFGECVLVRGPHRSSEAGSLEHTLTVYAENAAFQGRVRCAERWVRLELSSSRGIVEGRRFTLAVGGVLRISVILDWTRLPVIGKHRTTVKIMEKQGKVVLASTEFSLEIIERRRAKEIPMPSRIDFGTIHGGSEVRRTLSVFNDGDQKVSLRLVDKPEWLAVDAAVVVTIEPGEKGVFRITSIPVLDGNRSGSITFVVNPYVDGMRKLVVPVSGEFSASR